MCGIWTRRISPLWSVNTPRLRTSRMESGHSSEVLETADVLLWKTMMFLIGITEGNENNGNKKRLDRPSERKLHMPSSHPRSQCLSRLQESELSPRWKMARTECVVPHQLTSSTLPRQ